MQHLYYFFILLLYIIVFNFIGSTVVLFDVYPLFDINIVEGKGCYVFDDKGNSYLDLYGGHAVISVGHSHPKYIEAIRRQSEKLVFYSNSVINELQRELASRLGEACGYPEYSLFLVNSGAEANENAMKLASFHTGRKKILSFNKAFHGRTSAAVEATDNPSIKAPINLTGNVHFVQFNDTEQAVREISTGQYAAVIIEPIQGIGGIREADTEFLKELRRVTESTGTILIADEIQCGHGRSGKFFAHQWAGIVPDLITVAKGIANGLPMAGVLISPMFKASHGLLGTTFGGNHLVCAAAIAVLDIIEQEALTDNALSVGTYIMEELKKLEVIKEVRGRGLMIGLELEEPVAPLRRSLIFDRHIFTGASGKNVIRLLPPLVLTRKEADIFLHSFKETLSQTK